jgi:hypothetical protein
MARQSKIVLWAGSAFALVAATAYGVVSTWNIRSLTGVVLRQDPSPEKQLPVANAELCISNDLADRTSL